MIRKTMRASTKKCVALLVTFFLLASLSAHAFNATSFAHKLDHEWHELRADYVHSHVTEAHEPVEVPTMDGVQHLALHATGDIQPIVLSVFAHPPLAPVSSVTPQFYPSISPGLPDRDPPFRPPQSD